MRGRQVHPAYPFAVVHVVDPRACGVDAIVLAMIIG
jgi:hypothetical protein